MDRSLENHTRDFLYLVCLTHYALFFLFFLLNQTKHACQQTVPRRIWLLFLEWVLEKSALYFSVCPAEDISSPTPDPETSQPERSIAPGLLLYQLCFRLLAPWCHQPYFHHGSSLRRLHHGPLSWLQSRSLPGSMNCPLFLLPAPRLLHTRLLKLLNWLHTCSVFILILFPMYINPVSYTVHCLLLFWITNVLVFSLLVY